MQDLRLLATSVLMDMLSTHTTEYINLTNERMPGDEELQRCKMTIQAIQAEITFRQTPQNTSISDPAILLPNDNSIAAVSEVSPQNSSTT
jgi:hypothetical protein